MSTEDPQKESKDLSTRVMDGLRDRVASGEGSVMEPPELPEEVKRIKAVKAIARKAIIDRATEYRKTPVEDRPGKKHLLAEIQSIVDELDDAFVLVIPQKDGTPYSITFNPRTPEPVDPGIVPAADSQKSA